MEKRLSDPTPRRATVNISAYFLLKVYVCVCFGCAEPSLPALGVLQAQPGRAAVWVRRVGSSPQRFLCRRAQAQQLRRTGLVTPRRSGLPGPGIGPVSPAVAGGVLTIGPQGSPTSCHIYFIFFFL